MSPKAIDLFAGVGGLSLGFEMAGAPGVKCRGDVGMSAFHRADDAAFAASGLDSMAQLVDEVGPQVGVVLVRVLTDAGAVDPEDHRRADRGYVPAGGS